MKLRDIVRLLGAEIEVPMGAAGTEETDIRGVTKIEDAGAGDITFLANPKYARFLGSTRASAVIVGKGVSIPADAEPGSRPVLLHVEDPYVSFLKTLVTFNPPGDPLPPGIHPAAVVHPSALLGTDVRVGACAVVGEGCRIGSHSMICEGVVLGQGVQLGEATLLYPSVIVREGCRIGNRVIIQPGAVIGSDGFGFAPKPDGTYEKIPQLGIVVLEDDVEVGANTTIDRATMGETRIKKGTKLDNLIQVAHNVVIGEHTVVAAQAGISGSTKIGSNCMIGGQVGFVGHITVADRTKIGAQSGLHRSVANPGETLFGSPAFPHRQAFRIQGALSQLPELLSTVRELSKKVELLEQELQRRTR